MMGYLVLWKQPTVNGKGHAMYPVAKQPAMDPDHVYYTHHLDERRVFLTSAAAEACVKKIIDQYGVHSTAVVVSNRDDITQAWCDRFLPAWAWLHKYRGE